ncbi:MAG: hypothetical protein LBJ74_01780 [Heliobacteriaceae bacterium]|jgi:hypothetical protein|nr:hypothetical protein [Heliobacteriaceae bacterium]
MRIEQNNMSGTTFTGWEKAIKVKNRVWYKTKRECENVIRSEFDCAALEELGKSLNIKSIMKVNRNKHFNANDGHWLTYDINLVTKVSTKNGKKLGELSTYNYSKSDPVPGKHKSGFDLKSALTETAEWINKKFPQFS